MRPLPASISLQRGDGRRHVPVAREGDDGREGRESGRRACIQDLLERGLGRLRHKIKDPETLIGAGRRIEPGDVVAAAGFGLPDAEAGAVVESAMAAPCHTVDGCRSYRAGRRIDAAGESTATDPVSVLNRQGPMRTGKARSRSSGLDRLGADRAISRIPCQPRPAGAVVASPVS